MFLKLWITSHFKPIIKDICHHSYNYDFQVYTFHTFHTFHIFHTFHTFHIFHTFHTFHTFLYIPDFQNYLRTQAGNTTTVNVIICTVDYLLRLQESIMDFYWHYSGKDTIDQAGKESFLRAITVAAQVFASITEFIQVSASGFLFSLFIIQYSLLFHHSPFFIYLSCLN